MPQPTEFGELLRRYRLAAGLTQEALAGRAGLGVRSIQALEAAGHNPRRETADRLAKALGLDNAGRTGLAALARSTPRRPASAPGAVLSPNPGRRDAESGASGSPPNNLPLQLTSFVGRERELAEVRRLLSANRLVTLTGTGGCGKTRLGYQVATELLGEHPDGVWVVELAPVADPELVALTLAYVLGIREEPGQPVVAALTTYLRPKRLLLVVDNCEHLVEASASLVEALLRTCSELRIVATSRELLGVPGEAAYRVPSLAVPDPREPPPAIELARYEAVRLLVERARLVQAEFAVNEQNAEAVAAICSRLDGIPLALELAAARLATMTAGQVASRLGDRFRLLTGGSRTALRRQQTLRAAIDWSYDLLSETERVVLRRLAVFAGGCALEAAEQVCVGEGVADWQVDDLLGSLARKSLVVVEEVEGDARYRLLETIRQYAGEKLLDAGEAESVRSRHRDWCLALVEQANAGLIDKTDEWLGRLEMEHDNLRAGLAWCLETDVRSGLAIAGSLAFFWYHGAYVGEGHRWLAELLARAPSDLAPYVRGMALSGIGWLARGLGDVAEAKQQMEEGLRLLREAGDRHWAGWAANELALTALTQGDQAEAEELYGETRQLWREVESGWAPFVDVDLAIMRLGRGELVPARELLERAQRAFRVAGPRPGAAYAREYLGYLAIVEGSPGSARPLLEESLAYYRAKRRWFRACMALYWLSLAALEEGEHERARMLLAEAVGIARRAGSRPLVSASLSFGAVLAGTREAYWQVGCLLGAARDEQPTQSGAGGQGIPALLVRGRAQAVEAAARAALGDAAFARAWAEGEAMALDEAVEFALAGYDAPETEATPAPDAGTEPVPCRGRVPPREIRSLTPREREVAVLIARGLTNRQIAVELVITEATAASHVEHILTKLGFGSRVQVASWATEQGLASPS